MIASAQSELDRVRGSVLLQAVTLPWPPSVNRYWRTVMKVRRGEKWIPLERPRHLISAEGRAYRKDAGALIRLQGVRAYERDERVAVRVLAYAPDQRRRDLDNLPKAPLDVLEDAGIVHDDSQIDDLHVVRRLDRARPRLEIAIALLVEREKLLDELDYLTGLALNGRSSQAARNLVHAAARQLRTHLEGAAHETE